MPSTLPPDTALRAPTADDAEGVAALLRAREEADLGAGEVTAADVLAEWEGVDLATAVRIVRDAAGAVVGYASSHQGEVQVAVHPEAEGGGLGHELRAAAEVAARAQGARVVRQFIPTANTAARVLLLDAGWWPVHHYFSMQMPLRDAPEPPDVLTRPFDPERDTEVLWHLIQGAYAGVEGHLTQSLEAWKASTLAKPGWDPDLWIVAHDANGIVGAVLGGKERRTGVVSTLAVAHRARGRGHGRTLLLVLLAAFREQRLRSARAAVHGSTAAVARLFESVGMEPARHAERWEKSLA